MKSIVKQPLNLSVFILILINIHTSINAQIIKPENSSGIELNNMNVLYVGIDNPVNLISSDKDVQIKLSQGEIVQRNGETYIRVTQKGICKAELFDEKGNKLREIEFKVMSLTMPDVYANYGGIFRFYGGTCGKDKVGKIISLQLSYPNIYVREGGIISSFKMTVISKDKSPVELKSNSEMLTDEMKSVLKNVNSGDKIYFEYITAFTPDMTPFELPPINIVVN